MALSVFALGLNATAAVYTLSPSDFALPNVSSLAELLPHQKASDPVPDPVVAALNAIQSAQQQHVAALQENASSLQQNTALLQQDSTALSSLRKSITDEHVDVKKISAQITDEHVDVKKMSAQISTLIAKIDSLQKAIAPEITSSIPPKRARHRLTGVLRKGMVQQPETLGPVSVGGAPLSLPATTPATSNNYRDALDLYKRLQAINSDAIRLLRTREPAFHLLSPEVIHEVLPAVTPELATMLCERRQMR